MKKLFITTTNTIENARILSYHGVVSAHIVAGSGFFSDFAASFSDFFGGRSGTYRRQLESLYDEAIQEVSNKAQILGANAIVGLRLDMENVSGKGLSMFMINALGTAVRAEFQNAEKLQDADGGVSQNELNTELERLEIMAILDSGKQFPDSRWDTVLRMPFNCYVKPLTERYFEVRLHYYDNQEYSDSFIKNYGLFIESSDRQSVIESVYEELDNGTSKKAAQELINNQSLFDAKRIAEFIKKGKVDEIIPILSAPQPGYKEEDLNDMNAIIQLLDNLPDVGKKEFVAGGFMSKDGIKFICRHGHKNDPEDAFCNNCGENIKGLDRAQVKIIDEFRKRVEVLKGMLEK